MYVYTSVRPWSVKCIYMEDKREARAMLKLVTAYLSPQEYSLTKRCRRYGGGSRLHRSHGCGAQVHTREVNTNNLLYICIYRYAGRVLLIYILRDDPEVCGMSEGRGLQQPDQV